MSKGVKFLDRGQRTEDRGQRTEDRGQRTEDRGQRTEDRGQRTAFDRLTNNVKRKLIKKYEELVLIRKYPKDYLNYWFRKKSKIYYMLHNNGVVNIKPIHKHIWKIWYGTCYFSGIVDSTNEKVFIKVMGEYLENCYNNEVTVNQFIEANSQILFERLPAIKYNSSQNGMFFIAYDFLPLEPISLVNDYKDQLRIMIEEFNRIGIIHTDFDLTNIGQINGKLYVFDYGTSLCPISNRVGIRNSERYNHLDAIPDEAKDLVDNPNFYYDDLMHLLHEKDNACMNYIVSNNEYACAKLGQKLVNYKLESRAEGSNVKLLYRI